LKNQSIINLLFLLTGYLLLSNQQLAGNPNKPANRYLVLKELEQRIESIRRRQSVMWQKIDQLGKGVESLSDKKNTDFTYPSASKNEPVSSFSKRANLYESPHYTGKAKTSSHPIEALSKESSSSVNFYDPPKIKNNEPKFEENQPLLIKQKKSKFNTIGFYIGACFPHRANLNREPHQQVKEKFSNGYQFELEYRRSFGHFFAGFSAGGKFYENRKIYNAPADYFSDEFEGTGFTLEIPTSGKNQTFHAALNLGGKYKFSEKSFIDGRISLGYANSQHKITGLGDSSLKFSDDHLYWGTMAGLGWQINETASLMLYYMLDGHGKSDLYGSQLYSNTGLRLGIDF